MPIPPSTIRGGAATPRRRAALGAFGENLTVEGLHEERVHIGDRFASARGADGDPAAHAVLQARHQVRRPQLVKEFLRSERSGFYFASCVQARSAPAIHRAARRERAA